MTRVIVIDDLQNGFECHKVGCADITRRPHHMFNNSWEEDNLAEAEESFNISLGIDAGYDEPWIWEHHVRVFPCAKS